MQSIILLIMHMNESILPEFAGFVDSGSEYRDKASHIEKVMGEFEEKTESLKQSMDEIAVSISTISHAIEEGVNGVVSAADSTQVLVTDMDNISSVSLQKITFLPILASAQIHLNLQSLRMLL